MDKMTMAHALEARAPFLDYKLVEYAMQIPFRQKVRWGSYKKLLKESFSDLLPEYVLKRPKWGWFSPVHYWVNDYLWEESKKQLNYLANSGIFNKNVLKLLEEHPSPKPQHIWTLLVFAVWYKSFMEN